LRPQSAAIDEGVVLPTINDDFTGRAPDLGAKLHCRARSEARSRSSSNQFKTTEILICPFEAVSADLVIRKRPSSGEMSYRHPEAQRGDRSQSNGLVTPPRLRPGDSLTEAAVNPPLRSM
jgi:hypothetical protein